MKWMLIGYDIREHKKSGYRGLDSGIWPRPKGLDAILFQETHGLNLLFEVPEVNASNLIIAIEALENMVLHLSNSFGLQLLIKSPVQLRYEDYTFLGFDIVDLYTQETFLTHMDSAKKNVNEYGLLDDLGIAQSISESINDDYNYDVVKIWLNSRTKGSIV